MIRVTDDIAAALEIRRRVYVEEQGIDLEEDIDGKDPEAIHLLALDGDHPVGTARLLISGDVGKIGRVAVLKAARGRGLGRALVLFAVEELTRRNVSRATLSAQSYAIGFYEALGFAAFGPEFMDAGIPHREMVRAL